MAFLSLTLGNPLYWIAVLLLVLGLFASLFAAKRFGKEITYKIVFWMYWANFALHFLKLLFPGYIDHMPEQICRVTPENFCALFVLIAPFLLISKKKLAYDYLFYMGTISAFMAYLFPTSPLAADLNTVEGVFETARYYLCHAPLLYGGAMLVISGLHKLDYKRYFLTPLLIFLALGIVFCNCLLMNVFFHNFEWSAAFDRSTGFMNSSFELGPGPSLDATLGSVYPYMIHYIQIYYDGDTLHFVPVLWMLPLLYLGALILWPILALPLDFEHFKADRRASPYR